MPPLHTLVLALSAIIVLMLLFAVVRIVNGENDLEWTDLISSNRGGRNYLDWDRIGKGCGVVLCTSCPFIYAYSPKMDATGLALLLGVSLAYLGAVSAYAATLRARAGGIVTTRVSEDVGRQTDTTEKTAPITQ